MTRYLLVLFLIVPFFVAQGQDGRVDVGSDSVIVESQDTILIESYAKRYDPRKALLYAAVLPGLGQIYNKKYWKLPLVYGGMYATYYAIDFYNDQYRDYRNVVFRALEEGIDEDETSARTQKLGMRNTLSGYRIAVDRAKRERDFMIIIMGVVYVLQIIDAHVDAHLKEFDLNPRLQVSIEPLIEQNSLIGRQTGAALVFKF